VQAAGATTVWVNGVEPEVKAAVPAGLQLDQAFEVGSIEGLADEELGAVAERGSSRGVLLGWASLGSGPAEPGRMRSHLHRQPGFHR